MADTCPMENNDDQHNKPNKGSGDPVQRAAREARLKQNLRANLQRRKQKARALKNVPPSKKDNTSD